MKDIENKDLLEVQGGAIKWGIGFGIAAAVTFVIGFIDGLVRPYKCR